jgi:hypothetical protein
MTHQLFEEASVAVSLKRQLQCAERKVRLSRRAYPNRIANKRMSAAKAAEEIGPHGDYGFHSQHRLEVAA